MKPQTRRDLDHFCLSVLLLVPLLLPAQTATTHPAGPPDVGSRSIEPGQKPPDAPAEWKRLVGIYRHDEETVVILERSHALYWMVYQDDSFGRPPKGEFLIAIAGPGQFRILEHLRTGDKSYAGRQPLSISMDPTVGVTSVTMNDVVYSRNDAGSDPSRFFRVTPRKPIAELRAEALAVKPPVEAQAFRQGDLVELITLDPSIHLDIRYAQSNNFLSTPVYTQARAFLQRPAAEALVRAVRKLEPSGYGILIHDAYRPWYVTKIFWDATPPDDHQFVANPKEGSKHNRGCAVDLTLYDLATGEPVEMPGLYDEMSPRSYPNFPGGTSLQRWHRDLLRRAMESEGFAVNESEWWHFDYKDWKRYQLMNLKFEDLTQPRLQQSASPR